MDIIDRIYELFDETGKKPYRLCKILGITQSTFSTWKTRHKNPPAEYMKKIADYLGVSLEYLMTGEENPEYRYTTAQEDELLELFRALPPEKRFEYVGEIKGWLRAYAESVKFADEKEVSTV